MHVMNNTYTWLITQLVKNWLFEKRAKIGIQ